MKSINIKSLFQMRIRLKEFNGVAIWKWVTNDDSCGICRMPFDASCSECRYPGDQCPVLHGECRHCFHEHCIMKWINSQQTNKLCPMCRGEWKSLP